VSRSRPFRNSVVVLPSPDSRALLVPLLAHGRSRKRRGEFSAGSLWLALLISSCAVWGQSPEATISGVVTDAQGAVIVGAEVTARETSTGSKTLARTNDSGFYSLRFLPIGEYLVSVEYPGFHRYVRHGITLTTGQALGLNISLELGAVNQSVEVTAATSNLETRTSDAAQLVETKTIEDMPLGDRRSLNMIKITGAAVFVTYDAGQKPNFSLAGGRTQSQMFWIDGGTGQNMRLGIGQVDVDPPAEVIQEMKVVTNNYAAEYGGSAGGVVIATTKSGTNRLRGSLFEYFRNDKLDAANFFAPLSIEGSKLKPPLRYNVFGGTVGGPVRRDKTFFYFSYEGSRRRDGLTRTLTVPTLLQRSGDFSQTFDARGRLIRIYDPATTVTQGGQTTRLPFSENRIPPDRLDRVAVNLLPFYPLPNRPADDISGANNFRSNYVTALTRNNYLLKLDHNLGSKNKISGRYLYNSDDMANTSVFPIPASETLIDALRHQHYFYGSVIRVITPTLVNDFRFTYSTRINHQLTKGLGGGWPSKIGIHGVPDDAFPEFVVAGMTTLGSNQQERRQLPIKQYQWVDNLSWVRGRHTAKFGGEIRPSYNYEVNLPTVSGSFSFGTKPTGLPSSSSTGIGFASFLLGFPDSFAARQTEVLDRHSWYLAGFVEDDWTIRQDLTLNLGLRWETDTPIVDVNNRMNGFDPNAINPVSGTPGIVRFAGVNGWRTNPYNTDLTNFGPRFGFAWKVLGSQKTVLRGGYGIFYAHPFDSGQPTAASLGFELSASLNSPDNGITAPFYLRDGVPGLTAQTPVLNDSFGAVPVGASPTTAVTYFDPNRETGYAQQFNLGIQRELGGSMVLEVTYLANFSRKLPSANLATNQIRPDLLGPDHKSQKDRPFPQFTNVTIVAPTLGVSNYHAGVARFEKRFSKGLNILTTYTFSKFLDNTNEAGSTLGMEGGAYSDYYNRRPDYGPSENDVRHRFTWSSVYEIPAITQAVRRILSGWSVGSVITVQSGPPFTVTTQTNTSNAFSAGPQRADVLRNPNLPSSQRTLNHWFDTDAFRQPADFRFGNQAKDILRADGLVNFDFSILRTFSLSENKKLQLRGEFFNTFNHPNFGVPGRVLGSAGFGIVSSAGPGRTIQLGARFVL